MRGKEPKQSVMLMAISMEQMVTQQLPEDHPLRRIKRFTDSVLAAMSADIDTLYAKSGRSSVAPELMLRALLWKALFTVRSERLLEQELRFNILCRWFVGLPLDQAPFDPSTLSKNRQLLRLEMLCELFFRKHLDFLRAEGLLSSEHLSVDGTLLEAWASPKSMVAKEDIGPDGQMPPPPPGGRNSWVDFKGSSRKNDTHVSATDPDCRLASKGNGTKLSHELNVLVENRNTFAISFLVKTPTGTSEREAAQVMVENECRQGRTPKTVGGDRKYAEGEDLVLGLDALGVRAHFAVRDDRPNALARANHDDPGYATSIRERMRIEEVMGFAKSVAGIAKLKVRGTLRAIGVCGIALAAYNLTLQAGLE